jgi:tRNA threonylcarbamoyladenosine biosynthesis protein TsaE
VSKHSYICEAPSGTINLAKNLSAKVKSGDVIELVGDVGSGKTFFTKHFVSSLGSKDQVTSPTFVIKNVYEGKFKIYHYDLYRIDHPELLASEIQECINEPDTILILEWADSVQEILPDKRIKLSFEVTGENSRKITMEDNR